MKKKIIALSLCVALAAVLVVGGTLAYFTDEQEATNTFSFSSNVTTTLDETDNENPDERTEGGNDYGDVYPGQTLTKDPTVHVGAESANCYVRAFVTVNNKAALDTLFAENGYEITDVVGGISEKWVVFEVTTDGDNRIYEVRYNEELEAGDDTEPIFEEIIIPTDLTEEDVATLEDLSIIVTSQAVQSAGFDDYTAAWTAIDAE